MLTGPQVSEGRGPCTQPPRAHLRERLICQIRPRGSRHQIGPGSAQGTHLIVVYACALGCSPSFFPFSPPLHTQTDMRSSHRPRMSNIVSANRAVSKDGMASLDLVAFDFFFCQKSLINWSLKFCSQNVHLLQAMSGRGDL